MLLIIFNSKYVVPNGIMLQDAFGFYLTTILQAKTMHAFPFAEFSSFYFLRLNFWRKVLVYFPNTSYSICFSTRIQVPFANFNYFACIQIQIEIGRNFKEKSGKKDFLSVSLSCVLCTCDCTAHKIEE